VATGICASDLNSALITQGFPIEDAVAAFRLAQDKSKGVFRVVVEPS
jgi:threonine dehydrogenase-like Zn-dependent dehydrogenase